MPVVPMRDILDPAFAERYGVAAINVVDDLSLEAVLAAATDLEAPLIVQTSLKTVKSLGARQFMAIWRARTAEVPVPVTLHLDHCPDREWISICLREGWNSVLFDGSELDVARTPARRSRSSPRPTPTARRSRARSRASSASRTASAPTRRATSIPSRCQRVHRRDGDLLVRPGDRNRARPVQGRAEAHARAGDRDRRAHPIPQVLHGGPASARPSSPTSSPAAARR